MRPKDSHRYRRLKMAAPLVSIILSACGASEVMQAGPSTYQVSAQEGLITGGWPAAQKEAIAKGNQYCTAQGQHFSLIEEQKGGTPGFTPLTSSITFSCGVDLAAETQAANDRCSTEMQAPEFDLLRGKIELFRKDLDSPPPFEIAANDTFPTASDLTLIAKWATTRDRCIGEGMKLPLPAGTSPLNTAILQQDKAFGMEAAGRVSELIVALYNGKLTFGEFARKRYEIGRDAAAAERQFRAAILIADHQRQVQAQQAAQQQFQNNLMAWSTYMQSVNARQPQSVHVEGTVGIKTNCISTRLGNFVDTSCN